jgi:O-antigen ligase
VVAGRPHLHVWLALGFAALSCLSVGVGTVAGLDQRQTILLTGAVAIGAPVAYLLWYQEPAYVLTCGVALSPFAANWEAMGIPGYLALDRLLLTFGVAMVLLRAPCVRDRPRLRMYGAHWVLGAAVAYVVVSAAVAATLTDPPAIFRLVDSFGILPFLIFAVAPFAFRTYRQRQILLGGLVALGAYLGLTALFERINLDALILPQYILDPSVGTHFGRSRGPFVEASTNGLGLFACACAAAVAVLVWESRRLRIFAGSVGLLCLVTTFFTMQRNVWLATVVGSFLLLACIRDARRFMVPAIAIAVTVLTTAMFLSPTLRDQVERRQDENISVEGRKNMNRAAVNMIEARPLIGFGWNRYFEENVPYFEQSPDYQLIGSDVDQVHNVILHYTAELGLVGISLWGFGLILMVGGAVTSRSRGDVRYWAQALPALAGFVLLTIAFTPPKPFAALIISLWAGVVWSSRYEEHPRPGRGRAGVRRLSLRSEPPRASVPAPG